MASRDNNVVGRPKRKGNPLGEQISLLDKMQTPPENQANNYSADPQKQDELILLSQELAVTKKKVSLLQAQLKKAKTRNRESRLDLLGELVVLLPALVLFEVLKVASLKETKKMIKPLKPTVGTAIATNRSPRELSAIIGLSPTKTEKSLRQLLEAGFVKRRGLGTLELGEFSTDKQGRIIPLWYRDPKNPEHIMLLFPQKNALSDT
jgi:hypothetical protein